MTDTTAIVERVYKEMKPLLAKDLEGYVDDYYSGLANSILDFNVQFTNLSDGDFLFYDSNTQKWRNSYEAANGGPFIWYDWDGNGDLYLSPRNNLIVHASIVKHTAAVSFDYDTNANVNFSKKTYTFWSLDTLGQVEFVVNTYGADIDTRMGSDNNVNMLIVDAALDAIGVGGAANALYFLISHGDTAIDGSLVLGEQAAAIADVAGWGQFWVKNDTPNEPWFTDDSGIDGRLMTTMESSPAQITGNTDDWAVGTQQFVRLDSDGNYDLTGIVAGDPGHIIIIVNISATTMTLKDEDASSAAANRFTCTTGADLSLTEDKIAIGVYDSTDARWHLSLLN